MWASDSDAVWGSDLHGPREPTTYQMGTTWQIRLNSQNGDDVDSGYHRAHSMLCVVVVVVVVDIDAQAACDATVVTPGEW